MFQSYMMRNCVLGVLGEIVSATLARENLSEELKETRNIFFEHLEDHLTDTNGSVRGKVHFLLMFWVAFYLESLNCFIF